MLTITLASSSPRRRELLERVGYTLEVAPADVDETPGEGEEPADYARRLARSKAGSGPGFVVAADTVVHRGGRIFPKPADADEAIATLTELSGGAHLVTTAVCVRRGPQVRTRVVTTEVELIDFDADRARAYVATGEPMDKAGAYGIQGIGAMLVSSVRGSYTNVVGLPLAETAEELEIMGAPAPALIERRGRRRR